MERVTTIASYLCGRYQAQFGQRIDEMKLHKLLYFTQREAFIQTDAPLFEEQFEAWRYGPVMVCIRSLYKQDMLKEELSEAAQKQYEKVFDIIFETYAPKDSWSLSCVTHGEYSWQTARQGVPSNKHCTNKISTDDIRVDAERIRQRRFLLDALAKMQTTAHYENYR